MLTSQDMRHFVKESAKNLDIEVPGWYNKIDTEILDIENGKKCIAGQLGLKGYNPDPQHYYSCDCLDMSYTRGFFVQSYLDINFDRDEMNDILLKEWWIEEIASRKAELAV